MEMVRKGTSFTTLKGHNFTFMIHKFPKKVVHHGPESKN